MHMLTLVWIKGQRINLVWALFLVGNQVLDFDKTWKVDLEIIFYLFFPFFIFLSKKLYDVDLKNTMKINLLCFTINSQKNSEEK